MNVPIYKKYNDSEFRKIIKESISCADAMRKMGYICTTGNSSVGIRKRINELNIDISHWNIKNKCIKNEISPEDYFVYSNLIRNPSALRRKVIKYNICKYICAKCGNDGTWKEDKLTLQLHHKDGDRRNNTPENLEFLCPNCHVQTDNYAGRNKYENKKIKIEKSKKIKIKSTTNKNKISKRKLKLLLIENEGNFAKVGKILGCSDNAIRKWCDKHNLSRRSKDYKKKPEIYNLNKIKLTKLLNETTKVEVCKRYHISKQKLNNLIKEKRIKIKEHKKPVKLTSPSGNVYKFNCVNDSIKFLIKELNYNKNSMSSNVYKVLNGVTKGVFGWSVEYDE